MNDYLSRKICSTGEQLAHYWLARSEEELEKAERLLSYGENFWAGNMAYISTESLFKSIYVKQGSRKSPPIKSLVEAYEKLNLELPEDQSRIISQLDEFPKRKQDKNWQESVSKDTIHQLLNHLSEIHKKIYSRCFS